VLQEGKNVALIYANGLKLYKAKNYAEAYQEFKKVRDLMPGYAKSSFYFYSCDYMVRFHENRKEEEDSTLILNSKRMLSVKKHSS
jgi:hypothetical protein